MSSIAQRKRVAREATKVSRARARVCDTCMGDLARGESGTCTKCRDEAKAGAAALAVAIAQRQSSARISVMGGRSASAIRQNIATTRRELQRREAEFLAHPTPMRGAMMAARLEDLAGEYAALVEAYNTQRQGGGRL